MMQWCFWGQEAVASDVTILVNDLIEMYKIKFRDVFVDITFDFMMFLFANASEVTNSIDGINKTMFPKNNFFQYQNFKCLIINHENVAENYFDFPLTLLLMVMLRHHANRNRWRKGIECTCTRIRCKKMT